MYFGGPTGLEATPWTAESNIANASFGISVSGAGDVDGDGYSDIVVGVPKYTNGQSQEGQARLYLGGAVGLTAAPWAPEIDNANANFGNSVSGAGDVNGDGLADVIVGAPPTTLLAETMKCAHTCIWVRPLVCNHRPMEFTFTRWRL